MQTVRTLNAHREAIRAIVAAHRGANPRVFGSVARGEDTEESDLDILVDPAGQDEPVRSWRDLQFELSELLGVEYRRCSCPKLYPTIPRAESSQKLLPI